MDLGNSRFKGQLVLATLCEIKQSESERFRPISILPKVTDEFKAKVQRMNMGHQDKRCRCETAICTAKCLFTAQYLFYDKNL